MGRDPVAGTAAATSLSSWSQWTDPGQAADRPHPRGVGTSRTFSARYQIINEVGRGGMGIVARALDRLTGKIVTVKRLRVPDAAVIEGASEGARALLAQEFEVLAGLHHPNIINVLDYGFDDERQPYLIMDLEENARTILEAGADQPLAVRIELLVQTLRAVLYLHRMGVLHRDLKPDNVLVVGAQVKVLDFGLSCHRDVAERGEAGWAGTPAFMAPEVLRGGAPSPRSDLYSIGMIAYALIAGGKLASDESVAWFRETRNAVLPRAEDDIHPRLRPVLEQLLAKDPDDRFADAGQVIVELGSALGDTLKIETPTTRESFIQAAPFIGRRKEFEALRAALARAIGGKGSAWLIGGQSGVGKSRLLDHLRTRALVEGVQVLRGQAVNSGARPYHAWREIVSNLVLATELSEADAEVLKTIVPNIGELLGRPVADPPPLDSESALHRLLFCVEGLFRAQSRPLLVIVEDLQWAGSESLRLFAWLVQPTPQLPILLTGSFRDDEAPNLAAEIQGSTLLRLERLAPMELTALGEAMIGPAARREDVVALLERETAGIPFFVVEVMRALAESSQGLGRIADGELPHRVLAGGIQKAVRRRLKHVPASALEPLATAAVAGRAIDAAVMRRIHPDLDVQAWAASCARISVLSFRDQNWCFAHDRLRDQVLEDLSASRRRELHAAVAEALEALYGDRDDFAAALAHHWYEAGVPERELVYAQRAGVLALRNGACREAVVLLRRSRDLLRGDTRGREEDTGWTPSGASGTAPRRASLRSRLDPNARIDVDGYAFALGTVENGLSEAYYRLGDLKRCREHSEQALVCFGQSIPTSTAGWLAAAASQIVLRVVQSTARIRCADLDRARRAAAEVARAQLTLIDTFFYGLRLSPLLCSTLRVVNQCEPAGPLPGLAQGYIILALLAHTARQRRLATRWMRRGLAIAETSGAEHLVAWVLTRVAIMHIADCRWADARATIERATAIAERVGDLRWWAEARVVAGQAGLYTGAYDEAFAAYLDANRLTRRSGNKQVECWSLLGMAAVRMRQGRDAESIELWEAALELVDQEDLRSEAMMGYSALSLPRLRSGDRAGAYEAADRALWHLRATAPAFYWLQAAIAAMADAMLALREQGWAPNAAVRKTLPSKAREAVDGVRRYARFFRLGEPHACLWRGVLAHLNGHHRRAMQLWLRAVKLAEERGTPYERARAHLEIGRRLPPEAHGRRHHLHQAEILFDRLGCAFDLEQARSELAASSEGVRAES